MSYCRFAAKGTARRNSYKFTTSTTLLLSPSSFLLDALYIQSFNLRAVYTSRWLQQLHQRCRSTPPMVSARFYNTTCPACSSISRLASSIYANCSNQHRPQINYRRCPSPLSNNPPATLHLQARPLQNERPFRPRLQRRRNRCIHILCRPYIEMGGDAISLDNCRRGLILCSELAAHLLALGR